MDVNALKEAIKWCASNYCFGCPRNKDIGCVSDTMRDADIYIAELEERLSIMQESMETLEQRCNAFDALEQRCKALEKRNEPVAPVREVWSYSQIFRCRNCDTLMVFQKQKYCHECGQAVKWDG